MPAASLDRSSRSAVRTALSKAAPLAYASTALACQLLVSIVSTGERRRAGVRVASRMMPSRTRAPRTNHNQTRLAPNPLELDELLGLGVVEAVLGAAVGLAVVGAAVGLATVGVGEGGGADVAGAPALGEDAATAATAA